jgi:DUF971 family protein
MTQMVRPSLANSSFATVATTEAIVIVEGGKALRVTMATGESFRLDAVSLRAACRCAVCSRAKTDGAAPQNLGTIRITQCAPIGHYGVNIVFSDGHKRGIFPWSYAADPSQP